MATTIHEYNHTKMIMLKHDYNDLFFELLNSSATFDATHTAVSQVDNSGAYEVYGNGWSQGGEGIQGLTVTQVSTNKAKLDADDVGVEAVSGSIGPASFGLVWANNGSDTFPLWLYEFEAPVEAAEGDYFVHRWSVSGILVVG